MPIEVPAAVASIGGAVAAEVRDVSSTGVQLYVLASSFGLPAAPTLLEAALAVRDALSPRFTVMLDHDRVGEVRRMAGLARLVLPSHADGCIELGCEFEKALSATDLARLGSGVIDPSGAEDTMDGGRVFEIEAPEGPATPESEITAPSGGAEPEPDDPDLALAAGVTSRYRVYVMAGGSDARKPLVGRTRKLSKEGMRVHIPGTALASGDATEAAVAFMREYGGHVRVKVTDGSRHLWTGAAEVFGLEVKLKRPDDLVVSLGYERKLRPAELERLGLSTRVA